MFIIAPEQTKELDRLQRLLDKLGQTYRVFVTNLEKLGNHYFSMI